MIHFLSAISQTATLLATLFVFLYINAKNHSPVLSFLIHFLLILATATLGLEIVLSLL